MSATIKAKSSAVVALESNPTAETDTIVVDEGLTIKQFCDAFGILKTSLIESAISNLHRRLESMKFKKGLRQRAYTNKFHVLCNERAW